MIEVFRKEAAVFAQTKKAHDLLGKRVLTKSGLVLGRVCEVRLDDSHRSLEGVLVRRRPWQSKVYVSHEFVSRLTDKAVILRVDPVIVFRGRSVVSKDGKRFGRVVDVVREQETNDLVSFIVRRRLLFMREVPVSAVASMNSAIILKGGYVDVKDSFKPTK
ncbi:MAG: PRC-barrel domain-containing protein [Candidatus Woesearchaeota archaeon]